jgi:hypothetical protein
VLNELENKMINVTKPKLTPKPKTEVRNLSRCEELINRANNDSFGHSV